jgi:hypothetical protein
LANLINKKTKNKAYSIAPKGIKTFHQLLMRGIIKRPKLVIYQSVERNLLKLKDVNKLENGLKTRLKAKLKFWHLTYLDKLLTQGLLKYIKARVLNQSGRSISSQSSVDPSFFYLKSSDHIIPKNKSNLDRVTKRILQYKKYFNNQNIDFIFLPTPNKKTIYHDLVPLQKRPDFLVDLIKSLRKNKVKVIETYDLFLKSQDLLYHKDDSHWNEKAIKLVFKEISRLHNLM